VPDIELNKAYKVTINTLKELKEAMLKEIKPA
jgi:hypothetical protein